jgi:hypothetical protein
MDHRGRYRYRLGIDLNPKVHWLLMISNDDTDCDPDSDPDPDDTSLLLLDFDGAHGSPERIAFLGRTAKGHSFGLK